MSRHARRLAVRRETLAELGTGDLAAIAGADALPTLPPGICVADATGRVTAVASRVVDCDSLFRPCVTSTCVGD